jgi:tetratricopeptide (TPR) repeat protein
MHEELDEADMTDIEAMHHGFIPYVHAHDFRGAAELALKYQAAAMARNRPDVAADCSIARAGWLALDGQRAEALQAYEEAERLAPRDAWPRIRTAQALLRWGRPAEALARLDEARPLLQDFASFGDENAWLEERCLTLLQLQRDEDAVACVRELTTPAHLDVFRTFLSVRMQMKLELFEILVYRGFALRECRAFLEVAEQVAMRSTHPDEIKVELPRIRALLARCAAA